jgi:hypothetical protein
VLGLYAENIAAFEKFFGRFPKIGDILHTSYVEYIRIHTGVNPLRWKKFDDNRVPIHLPLSGGKPSMLSIVMGQADVV